jgi:hypothetical protein
MAGDATNIKLGACWVYFGSVTGSIGEVIDLGYTKGGVTVTIETGSYEILVDQEGQSPVGETILGRRVTVMCPLAETHYERLSKIIPDSTFASSTLKIRSGIGDDLMDYTDLLQLTTKADANDWIKVYKAAPVVNLTATFLPNAERIWPVQFKGYVPEVGHTEAGNLIGLHLIS